MRRRDGTPQWVMAGAPVAALTRADLGGKSDDGYDEAWLQTLLHKSPEVFPIAQIEPGFGDLVPLCRELPVTFGGGRSGALDNLYATAAGGLVLVEAKLWRNPEARRAVVAQAMEYAAALFRMSYEDLQQAVLKARRADDPPAKSLFEIVSSATQGCDEAPFIEAVSHNLKIGRAVIAVVGDGIRDDIAPLAQLLQSHAGHRFTFALVELAVYDTPQVGTRVVVPSVLAQTQLVERGVIRFEGPAGAATVEAPKLDSDAGAPSTRRSISIGEDEFYEILAGKDPALPDLLKAFLDKADKLGVYADRQSGLNLKHNSPVGHPLNLGTIRKDGYIDTGPATWWGRRHPFGQAYNETLAGLIGGAVNDVNNGKESALRTALGKTPRLSDLLPVHEQAWLDAIQRYVIDTTEALEKTAG